MRKLKFGCLGLLLFAILLFGSLFYYFAYSMDRLPEGEYLSESRSPNNSYTVVFYLCNGGATTAYSIRGELVDNKTLEKENIYWEYRQHQVVAKWIDDHTIMINNHTLDVRDDIYDWRRE